MHLTECFYHFTYEFQSESTLSRLPECQWTSCSKQSRYLKLRWQQPDSNTHPLSRYVKTQTFGQTGEMIKVCCEYSTVRCIWFYVIIMSRTNFRVNPLSTACLNIRELFARSRRDIGNLSDSNEIPTQSHLVSKRALNYLVKLAKWLRCVLSSYWFLAFDCMLL